MERPPEATLAGVAAAVRDFDRIAAFEADVRHVITRATAGLAERVNAAPALAAAARALLPQAGGRRAALDAALTAAEQAVRDLPRPQRRREPRRPSPAPCRGLPGGSCRARDSTRPGPRPVPGPGGPHEARPTLATRRGTPCKRGAR